MRNAVIGIGNLLRADDGVGIHVVDRLKEERPDIEAVDVSTSEIGILDYLRGREKVVIVDAIITEAEPGTIHKIVPENLDTDAFLRSHSLNLSGVLRLGSRLYPDEFPKKLVILAVEAEDIKSFSTSLTDRVESAIPRLLREIEIEFKDDVMSEEDIVQEARLQF